MIVDADLPGAEYRDAFKEDLVRRHTPRWNVNLVRWDQPCQIQH